MKFRKIAYFLSVVITVFFVYINTPLFYEADAPEAFGFYSDTKSSRKIVYDKCLLQSIDNSTGSIVDFYLGCVSSQLVNIEENDPDELIMHYGNCGHVKKFDFSLCSNDLPDYLICFPFTIENIGRACRSRVNRKNNEVKEVELIDFYASHLDNKNDTLITQWMERPLIIEFRFFGKNIFKRTSFESLSFNYYVTDRWGIFAPELMENKPKSFIIDLKIPKKYRIVELEKYKFSDATRDPEMFSIKIDLIKDKTLHLVIIDNTKHWIKLLMNWVWSFLIGGIILDVIFRDLIFNKSSNN